MPAALVAPSFNDFVAIGQAEMQFRRPGLTFREGNVTLADLHAAAAMADLCIHTLVELFARTFLDYCSGDDLTALVNDHLNLQRFPATRAQVTLQFTRTSGGVTGTIPIGTPVISTPDVDGGRATFTTDADFVVPAGSNGPFLVAASAQVAGPTGNVAAGTLTTLGAPLFDPSFTVTNPATAAGGNDQESDDELRERARTWWQTLVRGTIDALEYGAKQVPTVRVATVKEDLEAGVAVVQVTDADGNSTTEMVADVEAELEHWRAAGSHVEVVGGSPALVDLRIGLKVRTGFDVEAVAAQLVAAVTTRVNRLGVGEPLYHDMIVGAIVPLFPDDILRVSLITVAVNGTPVDPTLDPIPADDGTVVRAGTVTVEAAA